jgi:competence protein ComEA
MHGRGYMNKRMRMFGSIVIAVFVSLCLIVPGFTASKSEAAKAKDAKVVDLNNATEKDLIAVKGIGKATAKKIIANRPYKSVDELSKAGMSKKDIDALRSQVTVGAAPAAAPAAAPKSDSKKPEKGKDAKVEKADGKVVDLNNAAEKDLIAVKGIGKATAKKIIANRPYKSVDELSKAGMSKKQIDSIRSQVTAGSAPAASSPASAPKSEAKTADKAADTKGKKGSTAKLAPGQKININTASQADIELLPEIGPVKAKAIIDGRPFSKPEDIMKIKGIKQKTFDKIKDNITVN